MAEKELVEKSIQGDEKAFETLVGLYHSKILHYCQGKVGLENAEDLAQETFIKAYHALPKFRAESSFYTWVYRIAHNVIVNHLKKQGNTQEVEFKEEHLSKQVPPEKEDSTLLLDSIKKLPPKQRIVIELFELKKLSIKEIAAELDIPQGTVRSRLHYARMRLKEDLKPQKEV